MVPYIECSVFGSPLYIVYDEFNLFYFLDDKSPFKEPKKKKNPYDDEYIEDSEVEFLGSDVEFIGGKKWNVTPMFWWVSSLSLLAALYCLCLGYNALLALLT